MKRETTHVNVPAKDSDPSCCEAAIQTAARLHTTKLST